MARFDDIQEGDEVYSAIAGKGHYTSNNGCSKVYPIAVRFENGRNDVFTLEGKLYEDSPEAILFYVDGDNLYSTTRPTSKMPWDKVPVDTKVYVADSDEQLILKNKRYFSHMDTSVGDFICFNNGATSWSFEAVTYWKCIMLAEKITIDGITYPEGSK